MRIGSNMVAAYSCGLVFFKGNTRQPQVVFSASAFFLYTVRTPLEPESLEAGLASRAEAQPSQKQNSSLRESTLNEKAELSFSLAFLATNANAARIAVLSRRPRPCESQALPGKFILQKREFNITYHS